MSEYLKALEETCIMVGISSAVALLLGLPLGVLLVLTRSGGMTEKTGVYRVFDSIINLFRSLPFIILIIIFAPLAQLLTGRSSGTLALTVPLSLASIPFSGRLMEDALREVPGGVLEAAASMGTPLRRMIFSVLIPEALPSLIDAMTTTIINIIGYSAYAGVIGGGGLGDLAIRWGYYNRKPEALAVAVILIVLLVHLVQGAGRALRRKVDHR